MRRMVVVALMAVMLMTLGAGLASANGGPPPHGHMLILGVEFGPTGPTYKKCVDLANNQALPLNAHHAHLHTGQAGQALAQAGHLVIPTVISGINDCEHLAELFGPPTR